MRILYLSCHRALEHDELKLFDELGHRVFSCGRYMVPHAPQPPDHLRPPIDIGFEPAIHTAFQSLGCEMPILHRKVVLKKAFVDLFDLVVVMHLPEFIIDNWEAIRHKPVVWRTIGQSVDVVEAALAPFRAAGMWIVRYSPRERLIPGYLGDDAVIRFYKDAEEFGAWSGESPHVLTVNHAIRKRRSHCAFDLLEQATRDLPRLLLGTGNEDVPFAREPVSYDELKRAYREAGAYFAAGTRPASYTLNFMEAWMTGTPVVAVGPWHGSLDARHPLYEIPDLVENEKDGFWSDDVETLRTYLRSLLTDRGLALEISRRGRSRAIEWFDKARIKAEWRTFLAGFECARSGGMEATPVGGGLTRPAPPAGLQRPGGFELLAGRGPL